MISGPSTPSSYRVLTGAGPAAIAIIALDGPRVPEFAARHLRWHRSAGAGVQRATVLDAEGEPLDEAIVTQYGETSLELNLHGNPALVRYCRRLLHEAFGFVASERLNPLAPGLDHLEADAAGLAPAVLTRRGLTWLAAQPARLRQAAKEIAALDSRPDALRLVSDIAARGHIVEWFTRPLRVAVLGPPNAGKSTLVNALVDHPVSITSALPGTTRDCVEALVEVDGFPVIWLDTAGLRAEVDPLEQAGIERSRLAARAADLVILVAESGPDTTDRRLAELVTFVGRSPACIVLSKCDLVPVPPALSGDLTSALGRPVVVTSAARRVGLGALRAAMLSAAGREAGELERPATFAPGQSEWLAGFAPCP